MDYKDYYKALGVDRDASADDIKRAYRKLARKYHPDVNASPEASARFKDAGEAYEVLKDPEKKTAYDALGKAGPEAAGFRPPPNWDQEYQFTGGDPSDQADFSDFFETLFRRQQAQQTHPGFDQQRRQTSAQKGQDFHARLMLNVEDVFNGPTRLLTLRIPDIDDQGRIVQRERNISVNIPKGISEGQNIRLKGQGVPGFGGAPAGDLFLEVALSAHPLYRIDGRDLYLDLPVTPWEAALGGKVEMPTPGGKVDITIPKNARSGQKLRLKGKGLPGRVAGDLYASLSIVNPPVTTDKGRALYEKMASELKFDPRKNMGG
jgi:curved DNA-binding protein